MIAIRVWLYHPFLDQPGASAYVVEPAVVLIVYAVLIAWATASTDPLRRTTLRIGTIFGLIGSALQLVHLGQENFLDLGARGNGISALAFMVTTFLLWGVAGYRSARSTRTVGAGLMAGSWSAAVSMVAVVTFGFALMFSSVPRLDEVAAWAEFKRSGWTDVRAFAIANTLDAAFSHLLAGPVVGAILGGLGGILSGIRSPS